MSKIIVSPVKRWPGSVTLSDPLTYPQLIAYQLAQVDAQAIIERKGRRSEYYHCLLRGFFACVERWELSGKGWPDTVTADNIPSTPIAASEKLIEWLLGEVTVLLIEADSGPNE